MCDCEKNAAKGPLPSTPADDLAAAGNLAIDALANWGIKLAACQREKDKIAGQIIGQQQMALKQQGEDFKMALKALQSKVQEVSSEAGQNAGTPAGAGDLPPS